MKIVPIPTYKVYRRLLAGTGGAADGRENDELVIDVADKKNFVDHHRAAIFASDVAAQVLTRTGPIANVGRCGLTWPAVIGGLCRGSPRGRSSRGEYQ